MIYTVTSLSVVVLLLLLVMLALTLKTVSLITENNLLADNARKYENKCFQMQNIVYRKFNYHVPMSELHMEMEQQKLSDGEGE